MMCMPLKGLLFVCASISIPGSVAFGIYKSQVRHYSSRISTQLQGGETVPPLDESTNINHSALSMTLDELATKIGGKGRAHVVWDLFSRGVDPILYHNPLYPEEELGIAIKTCIQTNPEETTTRTSKPMNRVEIQNTLPPRRQTETLGSKALKYLSKLYPSPLGMEQSIASLVQVTVSEDNTTKLLLKLHNTETEQLIETVIIPNPQWNKSTLCVSCQVGCRQKCSFCATGKMGKRMDLSSDQILIQLYWAIKICRTHDYLPPIDNIVFMGMGDAADNVNSVRHAVNIMTDRSCFGLAPSKITISTVGPTPESFSELAKANTVLAWSVHAARDDLRKQLVPTTKYTMEELSDGLVRAVSARTKRLRNVMLEITLIDGLNDSILEAQELAVFANRIKERVDGIKLVVNLIPFNDIGYEQYKRAKPENVAAFQNVLIENGVQTYIRTTRGDEEHSACGQLATKKRKIPES